MKQRVHRSIYITAMYKQVKGKLANAYKNTGMPGHMAKALLGANSGDKHMHWFKRID